MLRLTRTALSVLSRYSLAEPGLQTSTGLQTCGIASQKLTEWHWMRERGIEINPCNSKLHPAVVSGAFEIPDSTEERSVQEAYTPNSSCYGCGPAASEGISLRSFRSENGLKAAPMLPHRYQAFPGIINGGILSTLFDCHGNWTAAIALMDRARLPRPPLTLTSELLVHYLEPTPPDEQLVLTSNVANISEQNEKSGKKEIVQVDMLLSQVLTDGNIRELAKASGVFKKMGALRAI